MISNRERGYLKRAAVELLNRLPGTNTIIHWPLKDPGETLHPREESGNQYVGEYISLITDDPQDNDIEIWIENYPEWDISNSLWFGLYYSRLNLIKKLIDELRGGPLETTRWSDGQSAPTGPVYDRIERGEYYLGIYERKSSARHEPFDEFMARCIRFIDEICLHLPGEGEAAEANAEVVRQKRLGRIASRRGQRQFSQRIRRNYGRRCAVTGCSTGAALEAVHIRIANDHGTDFNHSTNGILLRADIHALFDSYLITLTPDGDRVEISPTLTDPSYACLQNAVVSRPLIGSAPSSINIADHRRRFGAARIADQ